jgi:hypothetical protein
MFVDGIFPTGEKLITGNIAPVVTLIGVAVPNV